MPSPLLLALLPSLPSQQSLLPVVEVRADDTRIEHSCVLVFPDEAIVDGAGDGVVQIVGNDLRVMCRGTLRGAPDSAAPDTLTGTGVRISGRGVQLVGARVRGFRCGIWASGADGLVIRSADVSDNFAQHLRSTPEAEDQGDWLWPHDNEQGQWRTNYGAGIYVEDTRDATILASRARRTQNGLCLVRAERAAVHDNDFSFLSGWGLAMFRCVECVVDHNSFDFCVRGYSHGVYSRGQDSAGILFFEQNVGNVIAFNSATHGGDGFFGFAGKEALETDVGRGRVANLGNLIYGNDFSYAPAIGIEMTFSFDNVFAHNRLVGGNYGVWGGYSSDTLVVGNEIAENTIAGIAVEHGSGWTIRDNEFRANRRGVELWWDEDEHLLSQPWAKHNPTDSRDHVLVGNRFDGDQVGVELRGGTTGVKLVANEFEKVGTELLAGEADEAERLAGERARGRFWDARLERLPGTREAVGARPELRGRDKIQITEWGPYDWRAPLLAAQPAGGDGRLRFRLLGEVELEDARVTSADPAHPIALEVDGRDLVLSAEAGRAHHYSLEVDCDGQTLTREGRWFPLLWRVRAFASPADPREDDSAWRGEGPASAVAFEVGALRLPYGSGGPSELPNATDELRAAALPQNHFGTIATSRVHLEAGDWVLRTRSDDGVRVVVDGTRVIDNWTWHAPTVDEGRLTLDEARDVELRVEHFELDGYCWLELELERSDE